MKQSWELDEGMEDRNTFLIPELFCIPEGGSVWRTDQDTGYKPDLVSSLREEKSY